MEESTVYQAMFTVGFQKAFAEAFVKGMAIGALRAVLCWGTKRFGPPNGDVRTRLDRYDCELLLGLVEDLADGPSKNWEELLKSHS